MTSSAIVETSNLAEATARSSLYKLFSLGFRYPNPEVFGVMQSGEYMAEVWDTIESLPHLADLLNGQADISKKIKDSLTDMTFADFEAEFVHTFEVGAPEAPCQPYEGCHRAGSPRTATLLNVSEFYRNFGLNMSQEEGKRELPDHLVAELEFLHFLSFKEAGAANTGEQELLKGYILAQQEFLQRHLNQWIPQFAEKAQNASNCALFAELATLLAQLLMRDEVLLQERLCELETSLA